jgi:UTRA domain/Bacterial regulatory proteins, gntR family
MTADRGDDARQAGARRRRVSAGVLADRMAATLVHHEPGWRLPRLTAMARRYNVSAAEVDAAIDELAARHLLRRLPDGQVYRASPAEYHVPLEGLAGLTSHVDPMGGQLVCKSRHVSHRRPPEDIGRSLGLGAGEPVLAIRCVWTVGAEPAALSASYLPEWLGPAWAELGTPPFAPPGKDAALDDRPAAGIALDENGTAPGESGSVPGEAPATGDGSPTAGRARAVQIELTPPPSSVARSLRLGAGELVATVTVSFEDPESHRPVAITTAMLRPDLFRIVIQATAAAAGRADGFASVWTHAVQGWEP